MRRHLPNTINHTDCTRPLSGSRRNRYVRIIVRRKLLYAGSTEDHRNTSAAQSGAAECYSSLFHFGNHRVNNITIRSKTVSEGQFRTPPPHRIVRRSSGVRDADILRGRSQRDFPAGAQKVGKAVMQTTGAGGRIFLRYDKSAHTTMRPIPGNIISTVKITDAVVVPLDSSSCVKLRHRRGTPPHPFYHLPGILLSVAAGCEIIKFGRNRSYFQQNTLIQYDFCIFATSIIRTMPVPDTNLHHRFNPTKTSPNVAGIVLSLFPVRRVSAKTAASHRASSVNYIIGSRNNFQFIPLIIRNKRYLLQVSGSSAFYSE